MTRFRLAANLPLLVFLASLLPNVAAGSSLDHVVVQDHLVRERIPRATRVQFPPFAVTAPAHWSFQAVLEPKPVGSDGMTADFIAAPGNLRKSKIYVGIRERQPRMTMKERRKRLASEKGHRFKDVRWNGATWILDEFQGARPHETAWTAFLVRSGKEYLILAECPNRSRPRYEPLIMGVMKSVKFSSAAPATRSKRR